MKPQNTCKGILLVVAVTAIAIVSWASANDGSSAARAQTPRKKPSVAHPQSQREISDEGKGCLTCHQNSTPGIVEQWKSSTHYKEGVDCYSCHKANESDPANFDHY